VARSDVPADEVIFAKVADYLPDERDETVRLAALTVLRMGAGPARNVGGGLARPTSHRCCTQKRANLTGGPLSTSEDATPPRRAHARRGPQVDLVGECSRDLLGWLFGNSHNPASSHQQDMGWHSANPV